MTAKITSTLDVLDILRTRRDAVGRDYTAIMKSWTGELHLREHERAITSAEVLSLYPTSMDDWRQVHTIGTPDQVIDRIDGMIAMGVTGFTFSICEFPETETMRLFAERVLPHFR